MEKPLHVFCCYAREDQKHLLDLKRRLVPLQRNGWIIIHADTDISAGTEWEKEIHYHLNTANIILLLISPDFIVSDYCYSEEMRRALERHVEGSALVIPIILRPIDWHSLPFHNLQLLPTGAKPVTKWDDPDDALLDVTNGITKAVKKYLRRSPTPSLEPTQRQTNTQPTTLPILNEQPLPPNQLVQLYSEWPSSNKIVPLVRKGSFLGRMPIPMWFFLVVVIVTIIVVIAATIARGGAILPTDLSATATVHANLSATATTQPTPNATATVVAANPDPYSPQGTLVFYDSLSQPDDHWVNGSNSSFGGVAQFTQGAYHVSESKPNDFYYLADLDSSDDFTNFAFEVQMTIIKGDCGSISDRINFEICQDGSYNLFVWAPAGREVLKSGSSSVIHAGYNQAYVIAMVANGNSFDFYVNNQKVDSIDDATSSHGNVTLWADDHSQPTEVVYQNAKVWTSATNLYGGGPLALGDPLSDNSKGYRWDQFVGSSSDACRFTAGAYEVDAPIHIGQPCYATSSPQLSNFAFEVQMKIVKGDCGAILFRADSKNGNWYQFEICQGGRYDVYLYNKSKGGFIKRLIDVQSSPEVHIELGQSNLLAVVAMRDTFTLYLNHQKIDSTADSTYSQGQIGVYGAGYNGNPTEVLFSNAKVWTIS